MRAIGVSNLAAGNQWHAKRGEIAGRDEVPKPGGAACRQHALSNHGHPSVPGGRTSGERRACRGSYAPERTCRPPNRVIASGKTPVAFENIHVSIARPRAFAATQ